MSYPKYYIVDERTMQELDILRQRLDDGVAEPMQKEEMARWRRILERIKERSREEIE